jgi:hypothetical protein
MRPRAHRITIALLTAVAALGAPGAALAAPAAPAGNRQAATAAARALLAHTPVPPSARRATGLVPGSGGLLAHPPSAPATPKLVDRHATFVVGWPLPRVKRFYARHRPPAAHRAGHGHRGGPGIPANLNLAWRLPAGSPALVSRQTLIDLVALPHHSTGIRIDAQVVYRVVRPAGERVPAGVGAVTITRARPGQVPDLTRTVTAAAKLRTIIRLLDRLPIVQPGTIACPVLLADTPVVTFTFSAGPDTPALAIATEPADVTEPTTACNALTFAVGDHAWPSLLHGARFLHRVDRLVHARFVAPPQRSGASARAH